MTAFGYCTLALAAFGNLVWWAPLIMSHQGWKQIPRLVDETVNPDTELPSISIVVAALNEEATIEPAMRTLLALDYPNLQVIAVDDRSTDQTGAILDRLAAENDRITIFHVMELPDSWLGKNHALHVGSQEATGEYILFTDADVEFSPNALSCAARLAQRLQLDMLVLFPDVQMHSFIERATVSFFGAMFTAQFRPWKVSDAKSKDFIGIGAFNMVRASVYRKAGGHTALPMDVADDVKLGKVMKRAGGRLQVALAGDAVRVKWVQGAFGIVKGLEKNFFAGCDYNPLKCIIAAIAIPVVAVWPLIGVFAGSPLSRSLCALSLLGMLIQGRKTAMGANGQWTTGVGFPFAALVVAYTLVRSMVLVYRRGGVEWRETLYPLNELRRNLV